MRPDLCPNCGALPIDWVNTPTDQRRETLNEVVDALYRIMPNSDGYETKAFVAELLEDVLSRSPLDEPLAACCPVCPEGYRLTTPGDGFAEEGCIPLSRYPHPPEQAEEPCAKCGRAGEDCGEHTPTWQELTEYWRERALAAEARS